GAEGSFAHVQGPSHFASIHLVYPDDDVAVAVRELAAGEQVAVGGGALTVCEVIPRGHKVALRAVRAGESVRKFGWSIGRATRDIAVGTLVHTGNLATRLDGLNEYRYVPDADAMALADASSAAAGLAAAAPLAATAASDTALNAGAPAPFAERGGPR